jgi:hypothetical protein
VRNNGSNDKLKSSAFGLQIERICASDAHVQNSTLRFGSHYIQFSPQNPLICTQIRYSQKTPLDRGFFLRFLSHVRQTYCMNSTQDSFDVKLFESSHADEMLSQFEQAVGATPHSISDSIMRDILNSSDPVIDYKATRDMVLGLRYIFGMADILKVAYDRPLYVGADKSLREALEGQGMNGVRAVNHALEMTEDSLSFSAM